MKTETAVDWLVEQFQELNTPRKWKEIIEQAKEMEKEQICDAYVNGAIDFQLKSIAFTNGDDIEYYNNTYGK